MARKFNELRKGMSADAQREAKSRAEAMLREMPLQELRRARQLSQEQLAQVLEIKQASVSKLERRTDMYIQILRSYIEALGGKLEITAHFPEGDILINQFEDIDRAENHQTG